MFALTFNFTRYWNIFDNCKKLSGTHYNASVTQGSILYLQLPT